MGDRYRGPLNYDGFVIERSRAIVYGLIDRNSTKDEVALFFYEKETLLRGKENMEDPFRNLSRIETFPRRKGLGSMLLSSLFRLFS